MASAAEIDSAVQVRGANGRREQAEVTRRPRDRGDVKLATSSAPMQGRALRTGRRAFWVWIGYQSIKGTLTLIFIWLPLLFLWLMN